jgi:hypothetical protein
MSSPDGVTEDGLVGLHAGLAEHQQAVKHDSVDADACWKQCTPTTQMRIQRTLARCLRHYH